MDAQNKKTFDERSEKDGETGVSAKDGEKTGYAENRELMERAIGGMNAEDAAAFGELARELELAERELELGSDLSSSCMSLDDDGKSSVEGPRRSSRRKRRRTDADSESDWSGRTTPVTKNPVAGGDARKMFGYRFHGDDKFFEPVAMPPKKKTAAPTVAATVSAASKEAPSGLKEARVCLQRMRATDTDDDATCTEEPSDGIKEAILALEEAERTMPEEEPAKTKKKPPARKPSRTPSFNEESRAADELGGQIEREASRVLDAIRKSANLKGTVIKEVKDSVASICRAAEVLKARSDTVECARLRAANSRLEKEVAEGKAKIASFRQEFARLDAEMAALREEVERSRATARGYGPAETEVPIGTPRVLENMEERLVRHMRKMMDDRLASIEGRLLPSPQVSAEGCPPAKKDGSQGSVTQALAGGARTNAQGSAPQAKGGKKKKPKTAAHSASQPVETSAPPATQPSQPTEATWATVVKGKRGKMVNVAQGQATPSTSRQGVKPGASKPTKPSAPVPSKLKPPRSAAVVITIDPAAEKEGVTYANILLEAKSRVDLRPLGIETLRLRQAITGARILEIPGAESGEKADALASKLREFIPENMAKVARPVKTAEMRVMGLDDSATTEEVAAAVAQAGDCQADSIKVGEIRRNSFGMGTCWVRGPVAGIKKATTAKHIRIGWVSARTELLRQRPLRCFRCLEGGHVSAQCSQTQDRSGLCYRCGEGGHHAATCTADPRCVICAALGRPANHWVGAKSCTPPKNKKAKRPAAQVQGRRSGEEEGMDTGREPSPPPGDQGGRGGK
ncbi:uncharacterized protein LOC131855249 [Achroia grisella]|uniref:uncharacterized protein LOC131855249 n=1 Tax=Achroia grisella TaxID=688607 RepID=UPI0027D26E1E|nr:uncharacterized protein LOC131855249 [Achroia grisella]